MPITKIPLLITATFDVGGTPQVTLSCPNNRVRKHLEGLVAWFGDATFEQIVFVKNCAMPVKSGVLENAAAAYGKKLEFVEVSPCRHTVTRGKGYGEGDLIRQALERSTFLRQADEFFKITGKFYSPDLQRLFTGEKEGKFLLSPHQEAGAVNCCRRFFSPLYRNERVSAALGFLRRRMHLPWEMLAARPGGWIDTRLYRVCRDFYLKVLGSSYRRVQDPLGYTLEAAFYDDLWNTKDARLITQEPVIIGTSGTLGINTGDYSQEIKKEAEKLAGLLIS